MEDFIKMNVRNEIKAQIIRAGMTMQEVVDLLSDEYGWSDSVSNLSAKLQRESIRYKEVISRASSSPRFATCLMVFFKTVIVGT